MMLPPNTTLCPWCWRSNGHLPDCPEADDPPPAELCSLCGCELEIDDLQLCEHCNAEHPGD